MTEQVNLIQGYKAEVLSASEQRRRPTALNNGFTQGLEGKSMMQGSGVRARRKARHTASPGASTAYEEGFCGSGSSAS